MIGRMVHKVLSVDSETGTYGLTHSDVMSDAEVRREIESHRQVCGMSGKFTEHWSQFGDGREKVTFEQRGATGRRVTHTLWVSPIYWH